MKVKSFIVLLVIFLLAVANRFNFFSSFEKPDMNLLQVALERQYDGLVIVEDVSGGEGERSGSYFDKYEIVPYTARIKFLENGVASEDLNHLLPLPEFFNRHYRECRMLAETMRYKPGYPDPGSLDTISQQCKPYLNILGYHGDFFFKGAVYQISGQVTFENYQYSDRGWEVLRCSIKDPECLVPANTPDWLEAADLYEAERMREGRL